MNLCCGLRIKEGLDGVPQHPKSRTSINDKHAIQALQLSQRFLHDHKE